MSFIKYYQLIQTLDFYIRRKATGSPDGLARKLNKSKRTTQRLLNDLKSLGVPIKYSKSCSSYYYQESGQMIKSLFDKSKLLNNETQKKIKIGVLSKLETLCKNRKAPPHDVALKEICKDLNYLS